MGKEEVQRWFFGVGASAAAAETYADPITMFRYVVGLLAPELLEEVELGEERRKVARFDVALDLHGFVPFWFR